MKAPGVAALALTAALSGACGAPLLKLPAGSGIAVQDGSAALREALGTCITIRTLTAEIAVNGSAGGHRIRAVLAAGVSAPASARLEAVAPFGAPFFIFVAAGNEATLLLPRDNRVIERERPDQVLEALAGVPLGANDLHDTLTGCSIGEPVGPTSPARGFGDTWRIVAAPHDSELYLHRETVNAPWRLVALIARGQNGRSWRADYSMFQNDLPRAIRLTSVDAPESAAFDLHLALSQVEVNTQLPADAFRVKIPDGATRITLDELRQSGPINRRDAR